MKKNKYKPIKEWSSETYFYMFRLFVLSYLFGLSVWIVNHEINVFIGYLVFTFLIFSLSVFIVIDFLTILESIKNKKKIKCQ